MNAALLLPRRKRHRQSWLAKLRKRIADFAFYRSLGQGIRESWQKAERTIE